MIEEGEWGVFVYLLFEACMITFLFLSCINDECEKGKSHSYFGLDVLVLRVLIASFNCACIYAYFLCRAAHARLRRYRQSGIRKTEDTGRIRELFPQGGGAGPA